MNNFVAKKIVENKIFRPKLLQEGKNPTQQTGMNKKTIKKYRLNCPHIV